MSFECLGIENDLNVIPYYLANDPRQWPLKFRYTGTFNPYGFLGNGYYGFIGEFLINAFGGYINVRHEVKDNSNFPFLQGDKETYVQALGNATKGDPVPDLLPFQKELLEKRLPNDIFYKELLKNK